MTLCMLMASQVAYAQSGDIDSELSLINASITDNVSLESAPVPIENPNIYTPWELMHRAPMLDGFQWSGEIAKFITPRMYIGTPFGDNKEYISWSPAISAFLVKDATTYSECLQNESYLSYGLGERLEKTDILELKAIAKTCAQQFYGTYFDAKTYTTREEYIMMLMTMFGEKISLAGEFTKDGRFVSSGPGVESGFQNIKATAWYSPYLAYADEIGILTTDEMNWSVAKAITDTEAVEMLSLYTGYRMGYTGTDMLQKGMIQTENLKYNISFTSTESLEIKVQ